MRSEISSAMLEIMVFPTLGRCLHRSPGDGSMERARPAGLASSDTVGVTNPGGSSPFVLTCDHASNFLPAEFGTLGLSAEDLSRHIAWDPGALPVASRMAEALDATLIETRISRLIIDCNRPLDAPDLVPPVSETTIIPGN